MPSKYQPDYDITPTADVDLNYGDIPANVKRWLRGNLKRPMYNEDKISINLYTHRTDRRRKLHQLLKRKGLTEKDIKQLTNLLGSRWSSR